MSADEDLLAEQIAYYRSRAPEYDEWFLRRGRYDRGPGANAHWFEEVEQVRGALAAAAPFGRALELACGTGLWTERLLPQAEELTAVDTSPEMIAENRARVGAGVRYLKANVFTWRPDRLYDFVFFGFWLSHVPPARFEAFWSMVEAALAPGGRVFFVDSLHHRDSAARDHTLGAETDVRTLRRLNDGREFEIVKLFYRPEDLGARLSALGWDVQVEGTPRFFLYGEGSRGAR